MTTKSHATGRNRTPRRYLQNPHRGFESRRRLRGFIGDFVRNALRAPRSDANPDANPRGKPLLDELVHSARWHEEQRIFDALRAIHQYRRDHRGRDPERVVVSPQTWRALIVSAGHNPDRWTGTYALQVGLTGTTLFGFPLEVRRGVVGIVLEGESR